MLFVGKKKYYLELNNVPFFITRWQQETNRDIRLNILKAIYIRETKVKENNVKITQILFDDSRK